MEALGFRAEALNAGPRKRHRLALGKQATCAGLDHEVRTDAARAWCDGLELEGALVLTNSLSKQGLKIEFMCLHNSPLIGLSAKVEFPSADVNSEGLPTTRRTSLWAARTGLRALGCSCWATCAGLLVLGCSKLGHFSFLDS
ncbi:unnamed protein product [Prunus armeniaca]